MPYAYFENLIKGRRRWNYGTRKFRCPSGIGSRIYIGMAFYAKGAVVLGSGDDTIYFSVTDWYLEWLPGDAILLTPNSEMQKGKPRKKQLVPPITDERTSDAIWSHLGAGLNTTPADILYGILMSNQRRVRGSVENVFKYRGDTFFEEYPLIMHIVVSAFPHIIKLLPLAVESLTAAMTPSIPDMIYSSNGEISQELRRRLSTVVCSEEIHSKTRIDIHFKTKTKLFYMLIEELAPQYGCLKRTTRMPLQYEDHVHNTITVNVCHLNGDVFSVSDLSPGDDIRKEMIVQHPTFLEENEIPTDSPSPEETFNIHRISSSEVCNNVGWAMYLYGLITKPNPYRKSEGSFDEVYIHFK